MASLGQSLAGLVVTFAESKMTHANFKGKKISEMKKYIVDNGGIYTTKVADCTHLVATQEQIDADLPKVQEAESTPNVNLVAFEWLSASFQSTTKVDQNSFLLGVGVHSAALSSPSPSHDSTTTPSSQAKDGKKRSRDEEVTGSNADESSTKRSKMSLLKNNSQSKLARSNVPVDEHCTLGGTFQVYIDKDDTIFDATLNQTNAGQNNNKFYRLQLLENNGDFYTWTRWGRVGERGQNSVLGDGDFHVAFKEFEKKFRSKTGLAWIDRLATPKAGKYTFLELSYEDSGNDDEAAPVGADKRRASKQSISSTDSMPESKLPVQVQRLMQLIFNQQYFQDTLHELEYDINKMPLGKLSQRTLLQGYEVLKDLAALVNNPSAGSRILERSNQYFSLIPHAFGRNRPPVLSSGTMIKKEIDLLENLTDMQLANDIMKSANAGHELAQTHILDRQYEGLGMQKMTPLHTASPEYTEITTYLNRSAASTHHSHYKVQDIFRIERRGEFDRLANSAYGKITNSERRLLWHGSRCTNFGGILSQGLRIAPPEAPASGYMFGKGVYLADMSSKSANYCCAYQSGNIGLLLLCEAELGRPPLKLGNANSDAGNAAKNAGCISTWGTGLTVPQKWKDASAIHPDLNGVLMPDMSVDPGPSGENYSGLLYNEYIVYDVAQVRMRYLLRVEMA